jgi:tetratricopeptide (TPR) repeat protein
MWENPMKNRTTVATAIRLAALTAAALSLPAIAQAEEIKLQVSYANVPGQQELDSGRVENAIEILEERAKTSNYPLENEKSTLCAAYILAGDYRRATPACNEAVEHDASEMAYNNRGVLRAHLGDFSGSMRDFEKIRWTDGERQEFLATALKLHPRTAASVNFELMNKLQAKATRTRVLTRGNLPGARVESIRP